MSTYTVRATRWEHGWELHISDETGNDIGVTQSRGLNDAEPMVRDYLRLDYGINVARKAHITITPELAGGLDQEAADARAEQAEIDAAQAKTAAHSRVIARKLREAGLSGVDTAIIMGISPQRVSQLVNSGPKTTPAKAPTRGAQTRNRRETPAPIEIDVELIPEFA